MNRYDSTNIARNILIMIGKHPTERGLNSHLLPLRENLAGQIDWNSDMGTVRWDILDPDPIELDVGMDGDDEGDGNGQNLVSLRNSPPPVSVPKKRRRGRQPRKSAPEGLGSAALQATQHTTPSRLLGSSRHFAGSASSAAIIIEDSRSATPNRMEVDSVHVPKRRRTAATNAISTYRSTRSVKDAVNTASMGSPAFRKFQCMWTGCKAVLHNIDNLKRHVTKAHRARDPEYPDYVCKWENCYRFPTSAEIEATNKNMPGRRPPITEGKDVVHRGFPNEAELQKHLDGHIDNVRKSFGYGPAVLLSGETRQNCASTNVAYMYRPRIRYI